jgi:hypothetical protein
MKAERYRPSDALWQLRYAQLRDGDWSDGGSEPSVVKTCGEAPEYHIDPPNQLLNCTGGASNLTKTPWKNRHLFLNIDDAKRSGPTWNDAKAYASGLYGHVVVDSEYAECYKIEYWQYFGYNGVDNYGGDHEGDWCTVQLWYNRNTKRIARSCHYAHGDKMCFDLTRTVNRRQIIVDGIKMIEYKGPRYKMGTDTKSFQNDTVRFYIDQEGDEHVVVYIERDSHEFWPTERGSFPYVNEHNGKGPSYLTAYDPRRPLNLGEVENPLSEEAKIILWFNGYWGCFHHIGNFPPPGPALHKGWTWPEASTLHKQIPVNDFEG